MQKNSNNFPDFGVNKNDGLCECGCGRQARISAKNVRRLGWIKGRPIKFIKGHNQRVHPAPPEGLKRCYKCLKAKGLEEFPKSRTAHDGRMQSCKSCSNAASASYKKLNSEKVALYNRSCVRDKNKKRLYESLNPEVGRRGQHRRRARVRNACGDYTIEEIRQMYEDQGGLCAYCERPLDGKNYHVDHMTPLCRGGHNDWSNLAIACPACNQSKHARTAEEFMNS